MTPCRPGCLCPVYVAFPPAQSAESNGFRGVEIGADRGGDEANEGQTRHYFGGGSFEAHDRGAVVEA